MRKLITKVDRDLNYKSIRDIFVNEGKFGQAYNDTTITTWNNPASGATTQLSALVLPYNKAVWIDRVFLSCSHNVKFDVVVNYVSTASVGSQPSMTYPGRCLAGGTFERSVGAFVLGSVATQILFRIYKVDVPADGTPVQFAWGIDSYTLFEDTNFFADGTIMWLGDSISDGAGPTTKANFYPAIVKKWIENRGLNRRLSIKAFPGCTSAWLETIAESGAYKWPNVSSVFYAAGTNDAAQSLSADAYKANVRAMMKRIRLYYPSTPIYVLTPPPLANVTYEANAVILRQKAKEAVSEENWGVSNNYTYSDQSLAFCIDLGGAFDRTVPSNYIEAAGSGVHPSNAASQAIANVITTALSAIESQIGANKLQF